MLKRLNASLTLACLIVLAGCATSPRQLHAPLLQLARVIVPGHPGQVCSLTADGGKVCRAGFFKPPVLAAGGSPWLQVNIGTGPNSGNGDPLRTAFSSLDTDVTLIQNMFGMSSSFATTGTLLYSDILSPWSGTKDSAHCPAGDGTMQLCAGGSMTWPAAAGIPNYGGTSSWGTSYSATNPIPASFIPTLNQNTTGSAGSIAGSPISGQYWGYDGSAQGWFTPAGSGTVDSCTAGQLGYYATNGTVIGCLTLGTNLSLSGSTLNASGGSGGSVTLQTNGTSNGSQTALNIENGAGITCSNPSAGNVQCSTTTTNRTVTTSPTVGAADMGGVLYTNVSGGGTVTIPAISSTVFASGMSLIVVNYSTSTAAISTTPTINAGGGCVTANGIPSAAAWFMSSNGTTLDCVQVGSAASLTPVVAGASGTSFTPVCSVGLPTTVNTYTATGNLTINLPTGCADGQGVKLRVKFTASDTYTWNAGYHAGSTTGITALPTASSSASGEDYFQFDDDTANSRFNYLDIASF